jgi:hypothetical protein
MAVSKKVVERIVSHIKKYSQFFRTLKIVISVIRTP